MKDIIKAKYTKKCAELKELEKELNELGVEICRKVVYNSFVGMMMPVTCV